MFSCAVAAPTLACVRSVVGDKTGFSAADGVIVFGLDDVTPSIVECSVLVRAFDSLTSGIVALDALVVLGKGAAEVMLAIPALSGIG